MSIRTGDYQSLDWRQGAKVGADIAAAGIASATITPLICLIDSTIMLRAATSCSFGACMKTFLRPSRQIPHNLFFSKPAQLVAAVYFGTYLTANSIDTLTNLAMSSPAETVTASTSKFLATAIVSTGLTVYKDSRMAQILGRRSAVMAVPTLTYALFTVRDAITIFASFNLPVILAPRLLQLPDTAQSHLKALVSTETARLKTAQFLLPAMVQLITTPIHLLGLDFYNRRHQSTVGQRLGRMAKDLGIAIPARVARIVPAFGVGGVINTSVRTSLMRRLEETSRSRAELSNGPDEPGGIGPHPSALTFRR